jgi:hypothetical protein
VAVVDVVGFRDILVPAVAVVFGGVRKWVLELVLELDDSLSASSSVASAQIDPQCLSSHLPVSRRV